jgi:hypothetical protein
MTNMAQVALLPPVACGVPSAVPDDSAAVLFRMPRLLFEYQP